MHGHFLKLFHNKSPDIRTFEKSILEYLAKCQNDLLREKLIEESIKNKWTSKDIRIQVKRLNEFNKYLEKNYNKSTKECILNDFVGNSLFNLEFNPHCMGILLKVSCFIVIRNKIIQFSLFRHSNSLL